MLQYCMENILDFWPDFWDSVFLLGWIFGRFLGSFLEDIWGRSKWFLIYCRSVLGRFVGGFLRYLFRLYVFS